MDKQIVYIVVQDEMISEHMQVFASEASALAAMKDICGDGWRWDEDPELVDSPIEQGCVMLSADGYTHASCVATVMEP